MKVILSPVGTCCGPRHSGNQRVTAFTAWMIGVTGSPLSLSSLSVLNGWVNETQETAERGKNRTLAQRLCCLVYACMHEWMGVCMCVKCLCLSKLSRSVSGELELCPLVLSGKPATAHVEFTSNSYTVPRWSETCLSHRMKTADVIRAAAESSPMSRRDQRYRRGLKGR